jgi:bifunctional DNA-binding transcriptional regulator/antitoxin component of YhaV-PrlF toxin-antitoxin module
MKRRHPSGQDNEVASRVGSASAVIGRGGRITVPAEMRRELKLEVGSRISITIDVIERMDGAHQPQADAITLFDSLPPLRDPEPMGRDTVAGGADIALSQKFAPRVERR